MFLVAYVRLLHDFAGDNIRLADNNSELIDKRKKIRSRVIEVRQGNWPMLNRQANMLGPQFLSLAPSRNPCISLLSEDASKSSIPLAGM
jgi:hypothetical protein